MERLNTRFPEANKGQLGEEEWLQVECKRTFPLAYEQDLAQRVIPQRLMPWFVPLVDNDLIDVYLRIPARFKLNSSIFKKMLIAVCPPNVLAIKDSNTNTAITASGPQYVLNRYWSSMRNRIEEKVMPRMATSGSWPNWRHYLRHSQTLGPLWKRPNPEAQTLFASILGTDAFAKSLGQYAADEPVLFQRLLTQKIWLDQRA
jgi:hypothetical protein